MQPRRSKQPFSTLIAGPLIVLVVGIIAGRAWISAPATAADTAGAVATATRQAELAELEQLRTEVAQLKTQVAQIPPTPTATVVPSPTPVPHAPMNQPLPYQDGWTVAVTGGTKTTTVTNLNQSKTAEGIYILVNLTVTNNGRDQLRFPFQDLILVDDRGRVFDPTVYESILVSDGLQSFPPSIPTDTVIVYDVTTDVGDRFVLESRADLTFRVQVEVIQRG